MLYEVFEDLDKWAIQKRAQASAQNIIGPNDVEIYVIGQAALLEANLSIFIAATIDVDTKNQLEYSVKKKFEELLKSKGRMLDPVGHEAWMPEETEYQTVFSGKHVKGYIAKPVYIILSKAKYAPEKNKNLISDYLASKDLDLKIFELAEKYQVDLESFV